MKTFFLPLVLGLAGGFVVGQWVKFGPTEEVARQTPEVEPLETVPVEAGASDQTQRILDLEAKVSELVAELDEAKQARVRGSVMGFSAASADGSEMDEKEIEDQIRRHMREFVNQELTRYQGRLNLTPEQRQRLSDILVLKQERMHQTMRNRFENGGGSIDTSELIRDEDVQALAREFLSDEQVEAFARIQEEERQARNDMFATARLGQVSPMLGLSDEQKDAVYSLFYAEAAGAAEPFGPVRTPEAREQTDEALSEILTPEQFERYRDFRKNEQSGGRVIFMGP